MKKNVRVYCMAAALVCCGCKKVTDAGTAPAPQLKIIKQTSYNGSPANNIEEYVYDDRQRINEIKEYGTGTAAVSRRYTWLANRVQYRYYSNETPSAQAAIDYTLNTAGLVQERYAAYFKHSTSYEYDASGFIKKALFIKNGLPDGYEIYHYSGNKTLDSTVLFSADNYRAYARIFSYETGQKNTIDNENRGMLLLGKDQAAPLKRETRVVYNYPGQPGVPVTLFEETHSYMYDNKNRIQQQIIRRVDYGSTETYIRAAYEYIYQ